VDLKTNLKRYAPVDIEAAALLAEVNVKSSSRLLISAAAGEAL
jgi:hypothetical protein